MGTDARKGLEVTKWDNWLKEIESEYRKHPKDFLRQERFSTLMHTSSVGWMRHYWDEIKNDDFFMREVVPHVHDGDVGYPYRTSDEYQNLSPCTIGGLNVLYMMRKYWELFPPEDIQYILDVGGGYGNTCKICHNLGYVGRYVIADFPLMLHIQRRFLTDNRIHDVEFELLDMPKLLPPNNCKSLLLATNSVCEMPVETRLEIEPHYKSFDYLFFAHNDLFDGVDNMEYFGGLKERLEAKKLFHVDWIEDVGRNKRFKCNNWFMLCRKR